MIVFEGTSTCIIHGEFEWKGFYYEKYFLDNPMKYRKNCAAIMKSGNRFDIPTICPKCHRTIMVYRMETDQD